MNNCCKCVCIVDHSNFHKVLKVVQHQSKGEVVRFCSSYVNATVKELPQESRAIARKPRDAAAVRCGLKWIYSSFIHVSS